MQLGQQVTYLNATFKRLVKSTCCKIQGKKEKLGGLPSGQHASWLMISNMNAQVYTPVCPGVFSGSLESMDVLQFPNRNATKYITCCQH
jgi:hypothetical protein